MIRSKVIESDPMIGKKNWFYVRTECGHYLQRQADRKTKLPPKIVFCEDCSIREYKKQKYGRRD